MSFADDEEDDDGDDDETVVGITVRTLWEGGIWLRLTSFLYRAVALRYSRISLASTFDADIPSKTALFVD